jgi:NAD(P)-dependent dehydrogenase (short-subunit alcohol dehydrogenase family)
MTLVLITGATRGIGAAAALALAREGADVALVGRDPQRVQALAAQARAAAADASRGGVAGAAGTTNETRAVASTDGEREADAPTASGGVAVYEYVADLALMSEVRRLAAEVRERHPRIDVLANNAGALFASRHETAEGLERTFALNHLAPFLLTNLLRDRLAGGRVVTTASDAHKSGRLDLDDLQSTSSYAAMRVYGTTKLCNILFTRELARRAPELHANCFHPGVVRTGFGKNENGIWKVLTTLAGPFFRSPARGARSLTWLALSDEAAPLTGEYIEDERVAQPSAAARDEHLAAELWERSAALARLGADAPV